MISLKKIGKRMRIKLAKNPGVPAPLPKFKANIFNTYFEKKALVSFIVYPYVLESNRAFHTQVNECISICEILNELGYTVDLTDYNNNDASCLQQEYQLVIGFGEPVEKILNNITRKNFLLISYRNGSDNVFSDKISLDRLFDFYKKTGVLLVNSARVNPESWRIQIKFANRIIALGNSFIRQTFEGHTAGRFDTLDLFYIDVGMIELAKKDFVESKNHFLWFGSKGAIHKGLDLLLDFFSRRPELHLHVAGLNQTEKDFITYYEKAFNLSNIHNIGFIAVYAPEFKELMYKCAAIISPSASEGQSGAVLTVLAAGGLVPIMTPNVGIDMDLMCIEIKGFTVAHIADAVEQFQKLPIETLKHLSQNILDYIRQKHTLNNYKNQLKKLIAQEIEQYESI